jgi:allophanate hydrolase
MVFDVARGSEPRTAGATDASPAPVYATPRKEDLEFFDETGQERLFRDTLAELDRCGWRQIEVDFRPYRKVALLLYEGPCVAERWAGIGEFVEKHPDEVHPVSRAVLRDGLKYTAVDLFRVQHELEELRVTCLKAFEEADVLVVPTLPALPLVADVEADSATWSRRLGHYTNFVNLLRLAAVAVPAGFTKSGLPGGITLIGPGGSEQKLCGLARAWQARANLPLGATGQRRKAPAIMPASSPASSAGTVRVAVAGAHLRGQPLHADLLKTGARFVRQCRTAPRYRFLAFMDLKPPRPGLLRDEERAGAALVEVYEIPLAGFGALVASVAPPLAIGTVELEDGESVKGFLCESWHARGARDITDFGGWVAFRQHLDAAKGPR